jgi:hypothetical protein
VTVSELNSIFALQLEMCPIMDQSGQGATDDNGTCSCLVLAEASHSMQLIDHWSQLTMGLLKDSSLPPENPYMGHTFRLFLFTFHDKKAKKDGF